MKTGIDLIAEERQKQINNDNVSGECNDTALEEQLKIWFEKGKCSGIDDVIFHPQKYRLEKQGHTDNIIEKAKTEKQRVIITETDGNANIDWNTRSLEDARKLLECGLQYINKELEKQSKPKFKAGDWIINHQTGLIKHIKNVLLCGINGVYEFESSSMPIDYVDNAFHLWSVKDAKDGDVLYFSDETIVIFKDLYNATTFHSYCHIEDGIFNISKDDMPDWWEAEGFKPATKEQCGILFQKMKESGYEWGAEKKELKKIVAPIFHIGDRVRYKGHYCDGIITEITNTDYICGNAKLPISTQDKLELVEQKPAEWKQENVEELSDFENAMMHIGGSFFGENAGLDPNDTATIKEQAELLLELAPKTKWSEEDEKMFRSLHNLIYVVRDCDCDSSKKKELSDWIEYLKNRMQPQEWNEEDEKIRKSLLRWLQSNSYTSIAGVQINDVIAWLERTSLRRMCSNNTSNSLLKMMKRTMMLRKKQGQRRQINVTDKELAQARKEAYNEVLDKIEYHDDWPTFDDGWNAAILYLKKRNGRPQSHCKPNDDQTTSRLS